MYLEPQYDCKSKWIPTFMDTGLAIITHYTFGDQLAPTSENNKTVSWWNTTTYDTNPHEFLLHSTKLNRCVRYFWWHKWICTGLSLISFMSNENQSLQCLSTFILHLPIYKTVTYIGVLFNDESQTQNEIQFHRSCNIISAPIRLHSWSM